MNNTHQMTAIKTAPTVEPLPVADLTALKLFLKVDYSTDDTLLQSLCKVARVFVENYTGRALINQTWYLYLDRFPPITRNPDQWWDGTREGYIGDISGSLNFITIPKPPLSSVTSIKTYSTDNTVSTFSSGSYTVDTASIPGRVFLNYGQAWPTGLRSFQAVLIEYICGYGSSGSSVPEDLINAQKMIIAHWYENRGDIEVKVPSIIYQMLEPYVVRNL